MTLPNLDIHGTNTATRSFSFTNPLLLTNNVLEWEEYAIEAHGQLARGFERLRIVISTTVSKAIPIVATSGWMMMMNRTTQATAATHTEERGEMGACANTAKAKCLLGHGRRLQKQGYAVN